MSKAKPSSDAIARVERLRDELRRHDHLYFVENNPEISDTQYDALMHELRSLEAEFPTLVTEDSPTQRVGERPLDGFAHVEHAIPMMSIDNTYSPAELREFDTRVRRLLEEERYEYVVDPKIDGVAVALRYEHGRLTLGATRGDGRTGDDVTQNIRAIRSIPLRLRGDDPPELLEARGEIFWPRPGFDQCNHKRVAAGEAAFKNPRNATAGTLKQLDSSVVAKRGLAFQCHGYGRIERFPGGVTLQTELFARFRDWGLPTSPHQHVCGSIDEVVAFVEAWAVRRAQLDYETDGLVVKVNQLALREALGATAKAPRWCIAYKYAAEQAQTTLIGVDFQIGKLGTITPRARLEPVELSGTTVRHASLHNFDQVKRLDLHLGDIVSVEKAGEIIPQIISVDHGQRPADAKPVEPPAHCPSCGGEVVQDAGGVYLRCVNPACPAQLVEKLRFFCGRDQMDIDVAGDVLIEKLIEKNVVKSYTDLYRLAERRAELAGLGVSTNARTGSPISLGQKRVDKLIEGIENSKRRPLARLLAALNIRHVGGNTAELLAEAFGSIDALRDADTEALQQVDGIGPEVATSLRAWLDSEFGQATIADLKSVGANLTQPRSESRTSGALAGKTFVVTGTLEHYGRKEIAARIKALGGKTAASVSRSTDYVLIGDKPGSKLKKARELGIAVVDEAEFERLARGNA